MTAEERARVSEIRSRAKAADTVFLLELVEKLDGERARAVASASVYKELGDEYEKAAEREETELRAEFALAKERIESLERLVPAGARN